LERSPKQFFSSRKSQFSTSRICCIGAREEVEQQHSNFSHYFAGSRGMPLKNYGVLKGRAISSRLGAGQSPHYQIHIVDDTTDYRIAINVKSQLEPSELYYLVDEQFQHPLIESVSGLELGFHPLLSAPSSGALDFIRGNLLDTNQMVPLPHSVPGPDNDLNEKLHGFVSRAIDDELAKIYAFGERWGPEPHKKDKHFGFFPGNGIHDIHMNQGSAGRFKKDNGVWQDGALLIHFPAIRSDDDRILAVERWVAVFLAFQSQSFHTDDSTGHRLPGVGVGIPGVSPNDPSPPQDDGDGRVRIVGALVNPHGHDPGMETVSLLNLTDQAIDLSGWRIADKHKQSMILDGITMAAGETVRITLSGDDAQLGNKGGIVSLLDSDALKVHGVAFTRADAARSGWTITF
jgi:uncharacterized protein YukJ